MSLSRNIVSIVFSSSFRIWRRRRRRRSFSDNSPCLRLLAIQWVQITIATFIFLRKERFGQFALTLVHLLFSGFSHENRLVLLIVCRSLLFIQENLLCFFHELKQIRYLSFALYDCPLALASPLFLSGWYCKAFFRYALLIVFASLSTAISRRL